MMSNINPEFVFPIETALLMVARDILRDCRARCDFRDAFFRLSDIRSAVHFSLGVNHPLFKQITVASDAVIMGEWPDL